MKNNERIVYSINVEDLQNVAEEELGRKLTPTEIGLVENQLGDFISWHEAVVSAIEASVESTADDIVR